MLSKIGNLTIEVEKKPKNNKEFAYFKKDYNLEKMKYKIFLEKYLEYEKEDYIYYWAERKLPKKLIKDIKEPNFGKILNLEDINIWQV